MKKLFILALSLFMAAAFFGCGKNDGDLGKQTTVDLQNGYTLVEEVKSFKMNNDDDIIKKLDGVKKFGFKITEGNRLGEINNKSDALKVAMEEVDVEYNSIRFAFDRTRGIWRIIFSNDKEIEKNGVKHVESEVLETIYVDEDGYTLLIYKGEVK